MARIVCKFKLNRVTHWKNGEDELRDLEMQPVYDADKESENGKFWRWTPSGKIELSTVNKVAADGLELNKEYYVLITDEKPEGV